MHTHTRTHTKSSAQQGTVSHFVLGDKRLQQRRAAPILTRICRTVQHAPLCCGGWISLPAHTVGCRGHRDLLGNGPHYKPHPHNAVKVYDIIHPCHRRSLQSERDCTSCSDQKGNPGYVCYDSLVFLAFICTSGRPCCYMHVEI